MFLGQTLLIGASVDFATWLIQWLWMEKHRYVWDKIDAVMNLAYSALHEIASYTKRLKVPPRSFGIHSHVAR